MLNTRWLCERVSPVFFLLTVFILWSKQYICVNTHVHTRRILHHLLEQSNKGGSHLWFVIHNAQQRPGFSYWWGVEQSQHHHVSDRELIPGMRKCRCCQNSSITFMNGFLNLSWADHLSLTKESCDTRSSEDPPHWYRDASRLLKPVTLQATPSEFKWVYLCKQSKRACLVLCSHLPN